MMIIEAINFHSFTEQITEEKIDIRVTMLGAEATHDLRDTDFYFRKGSKTGWTDQIIFDIPLFSSCRLDCILMLNGTPTRWWCCAKVTYIVTTPTGTCFFFGNDELSKPEPTVENAIKILTFQAIKESSFAKTKV